MLTLGLPALLICILCAAAYSTADYFRKVVPDTSPPAQALFYAVALEAPVLLVWLLVSGDTHISAGYLLPGLIDAALGLGANLLFIVAIRRSPLSLMIPLLTLVPILTALISGGLIGEWPSAHQAAGIVVVTAGLFLVFIPAHGGFHPLAVWRNLSREPGAMPMAGVVLFWSASPPMDKICLTYSSVGMHGLTQLLLLWLTVGIWLLRTGGRQALKLSPGAGRPLFGVAVMAGLGYGLQLAGYQLTLVAIVELFKRTIGLVGALFWGRAFFRETLTAPKIAGIAVIAMGMPLVLLG